MEVNHWWKLVVVTCIQLIINAFRHGMSAVPVWGIDEFVMDVFYWFKNYPARREDYHNLYSSITDEEISTSFLRFVDNRWLSIGPVIDRVLEHFDVLCEFDMAASENAHFRRICAHLQEKLITQARLQFVRSMSKELNVS